MKRVGIGEALRISKSSQEEGDKEGIPGKKKKGKGVERVINMVYLGTAGRIEIL